MGPHRRRQAQLPAQCADGVGAQADAAAAEAAASAERAKAASEMITPAGPTIRSPPNACAARSSSCALSATTSSSLTPDLQIGLRNGMALTLSYASRGQRNDNNGNATLLDQDDLSASFSHSFRLPASIARSRKLVRSSLSALTSKTLTCLQRLNQGGCTVISDVRRREIRGGLDTDIVSTVSAGLQFGYSLSDSRHLSQRNSQIFLLASFQLSLFAGTIGSREGREASPQLRPSPTSLQSNIFRSGP